MATLNVELSDSAYEQLQAMAAEQQIPISDLIARFAEQPYFELTDAQMKEVDLAIAALDRGEIASDDTVRAFFKKYAE